MHNDFVHVCRLDIILEVNQTFVRLYIRTVRSYGTEDRRADRPVPPKDEMYEYIIFRGSDIQDITVSEPRKQHHGLPRDPAIVQVSGSEKINFK